MARRRTTIPSLLLISAITFAGCSSSEPVLPTLAVLPSVTPTLSDVEWSATSEQMTATHLPTATDAPSATPAPTETPLPSETPSPEVTATPAFDVGESTRAIREGLDLLSEADVTDVRVTDGREAIIAYVVSATDLPGVQAEGVDVLIAVAAAIKNFGLDLETVMLVVGNPDGNVAGTILVYVDDLIAFYTGNIRRDELLARLVVTELQDVVPAQAAPATEVWTLAPAAASTSVPAARSWNCSGDLYKCDDFASRAEMNSYIAACPGDPSNLDGDDDGEYCE